MKLARTATLALAAAGIVVATGLVGHAAIAGADGQVEPCYTVKNGLAHTKGDTRLGCLGDLCQPFMETRPLRGLVRSMKVRRFAATSPPAHARSLATQPGTLLTTRLSAPLREDALSKAGGITPTSSR